MNKGYLFKGLNENFVITETDENGVITSVNDRFLAVSGFGADELIGKTHKVVNSGVHDKSFFKEMWETISLGKVWSGRVCNKTKNGELYWCQVYIFPKIIEGEPKGYFALRHDISDSVELEQKIKNMEDEEEINSHLISVGEISAGIAHEINNPLTIILSCMRLIQRKSEPNSNIGKLIESIDKSVDRIVSIINGLHRLSQSSRDESCASFEIDDLFLELTPFYTEMLHGKNIKYTFENISKSKTILCNEVKLSQAILNLINNAKDAIQENEDKWIKIKVEDTQKNIKISVVDSGSGIDKDLKNKIFNKLFTTKKIGAGSGLGLSLVKKYIKSQNGRFYLCEECVNTCFVIELPKAE